MLSKEKVLSDLTQSTTKLLDAILKFPASDFHKNPAENSWSVAEVAGHILALENLLNPVLKGETKATIDRDPEQKIKIIRSAFLDLSQKYNAPNMILPSNNTTDKEDLLKKIKDCRQTLVNILISNDLTETCMGFKHFAFGKLSRIEWTYFNIYHTERHLHQIENIKKQLNIP
jgi:hypothetical protein